MDALAGILALVVSLLVAAAVFDIRTRLGQVIEQLGRIAALLERNPP
jgi:hypothetical protein